jgi:hypothetical protein
LAGGARPRSEKRERQVEAAEIDVCARSNWPCGPSNLPSRSISPVGYSIRRRAPLSQSGIAPQFQRLLFSRIAAGNALPSARVNFPWPSFSSTATCLCCNPDVTSTSIALSPFTSRAIICSPPAGAVTPKTCAAPVASCNLIEYSVILDELLVWSSTVAKSGFRSPSKSAMAKEESNPGEEAGEFCVEVPAASARHATPAAKHKIRRALRLALATPRLSWIQVNINSNYERSFLALPA